MELLADIFKAIGMKSDSPITKEYLEKALNLYELCNSSDKTFSFDRERKISEIKNIILHQYLNPSPKKDSKTKLSESDKISIQNYFQPLVDDFKRQYIKENPNDEFSYFRHTGQWFLVADGLTMKDSN